jgi:formylglycine-generating enzyme required for sulfatase activity
LSARTGKAYRLASEEEWEHAARAGATTAYSFGDDEKALGEYAWFVDNSDEGPHPVGTKKPNAWGIFDMHGNVGEWVTTNDKDVKGNQGCVKGGSWQGSAEDAKVAARAQWEAPWQKTDPQIPKSKWWMSDGQHVGIRVVCEADESGKPRIVKPEKPASEVKAEPKESAPEK